MGQFRDRMDEELRIRGYSASTSPRNQTNRGVGAHRADSFFVSAPILLPLRCVKRSSLCVTGVAGRDAFLNLAASLLSDAT